MKKEIFLKNTEWRSIVQRMKQKMNENIDANIGKSGVGNGNGRWVTFFPKVPGIGAGRQ
jgi:hypothetical protein